MINIVSIIRKIDKYCGTFIVLLLSFFKKFNRYNKKKNNFNKSVLVIRLWAIGESLLILPMLKKLKEKGYQVDLLVTKRNKGVFENQDFIDNILEFEKIINFLPQKFRKYNLVIDTEPYLNISAILSFVLGKKSIGFRGLVRDRIYDYKINYDSNIHTVMNFCNLLKPLKIEYFPKKLLPVKYKEEDKNKVEKLLKDYGLMDKEIIGIHCGTAETSPWRSWKEEKFAKLIENLAKMGFYIILTGTGKEVQKNERIKGLISDPLRKKVLNFAGKTNLRELAYLMQKFKYFISNDTGPMHLSAAMGTKTIGLFGPNLPERFAPFGAGNIAIYKAFNLSCSPCINVHKGEFKKCKLNGRCMDLIEVEDIFRNIR